MSEALTWDQLASIYHEKTGQQARIQPMDKIFEWAKKQTDIFKVDPIEGTLHLIGENK